MDSRLEKGPVCGVENCRSRWYEEGEDGYRYCQNGHQQFGLVRAADDDDDFTLATTTRIRKKKDGDDQIQVAKHFSGRQGLDLYLKCLQLILRHQLWFLVKEKGLPEELELITLDLWALRIAQLGDRIASDSHADSQSQSQVFSTLETDDSETNDVRGPLRTSKGREKRLGDIPNLLDCLGLCYLGILTLRLPTTPGDIYHWATEDKLAYSGAIKRVPLPMRDRLPASYHATLNPNALLSYKRFYAAVTDLRVSFTNDHKIEWAPLNHRLLLFRYIKSLALPLEVYDITIRLSHLLSWDFTLRQDHKGTIGVRHLPEAQLAGCLIVCINLIYPFDGGKRHPHSAVEPTATVMDWTNWQEQIQLAKAKQKGDDHRYTVEELTKLEERDVFDMPLDRLDQYLDFYADTFLDDAEVQRIEDTDDFRNAIYSMFPTGRKATAAVNIHQDISLQEDELSAVKAVHNSLQARSVILDDGVGVGVLRPGQAYHLYKKEGDLPEYAKVLYEEVARLAGLSMEMLVIAVYYTEARIEKWRRNQKDIQKQTVASSDGVYFGH